MPSQPDMQPRNSTLPTKSLFTVSDADLSVIGNLGLHPTLLSIFETVRSIARQYPRAEDCSSRNAYRQLLSVQSAILQKLINFDQQCPKQLDNLSNAFKHGILLYLLNPWQDQQPSPAMTVSAIFSELLVSIRAILRAGFCNDLVLWLISIAVAVTARHGYFEHAWCIRQLASITVQLSIYSHEQFTKHLKRVIWNKYQDPGRYHFLWTELSDSKPDNFFA